MIQTSENRTTPQIETNWIVITGCPSSGKTTVVEEMHKYGFTTKPEPARRYYSKLAEASFKIENIRCRANISHNQERILQYRIEDAKYLDPEQAIIFDTGIPESLLRLEMYAQEGMEIDPRIMAEAERESEHYRYRKIFHLEPLDFVTDGIRTEDKETVSRLHALTREIYLKLGYDVILVPRFSELKEQSIEDRVEFIRSCLT